MPKEDVFYALVVCGLMLLFSFLLFTIAAWKMHTKEKYGKAVEEYLSEKESTISLRVLSIIREELMRDFAKPFMHDEVKKYLYIKIDALSKPISLVRSKDKKTMMEESLVYVTAAEEEYMEMSKRNIDESHDHIFGTIHVNKNLGKVQ